MRFEAESRPAERFFTTATSAADQQRVDFEGDFKLLTEWPESTAREKTGQKRENTA
jgi:hypothetical protein